MFRQDRTMFLLMFTIVSFVLLNAAMGVPVRQKRSTTDSPWITPCVLNVESGGQDLPPGIPPPPTSPPPSQKELIQTFRYRIEDAANKADDLKRTMFTERLESNLKLDSIFESLHIEGIPLVSEIGEWTNSNDTTKIVKANYKSLSTFLVFLDQVKLDEIEHNNSTVKKPIEDLIDDIYNSLCTLHNLLYCLNESIDDHITSDVMPQSQKEITIISQRNQRDYVITKDAKHFLFALKDRYIFILSQI